MTTIVPQEVKCSMCGSISKQQLIASTNTFMGSPDLDLRPAEMARSTMVYWIQECPDCGYVSADISRKMRIAKAFLKTDEYINCDGNKLPKLAQLFYRYYLINLQKNSIESAFYAILHSAWDCDDHGDVDNAIMCRNKAITLIENLIRKKKGEDRNTLLLIKADLFRRAKKFDEMIEEYKDITFKDELLNKILAFQINKANQKDSSRYTINDVSNN